MNSVLLVTATKTEAMAVLDLFSQTLNTKWERIVLAGKTYFELGRLSDLKVFMVLSEMGAAGPGGALLTINNAINALSPSKIIMVGIAFGAKPDTQQLGEILVSRQLASYESQKLRQGQRPVVRGDRITASVDLLDLFRSADLDWKGAKVHFGLLLSGEKLVNDKKFLSKLLALESEAIGGEMEGSGLYAAASSAKVSWIVVKAICDWANGEKNDNFQALAAENAAKFVLHALRQASASTSVAQSEQTRYSQSSRPTPFPIEAGDDVPYGLRRGGILLLNEFSPLRTLPTAFHVGTESSGVPHIYLKMDMKHLDIFNPTNTPAAASGTLSEAQTHLYNQVLSHWHGGRPNEICICFGSSPAIVTADGDLHLNAQPIDFVRGYLLSMLPRSYAIRSLTPPLISPGNDLYFPLALGDELRRFAKAFMPDQNAFQPLGVRVLVVSRDGYGILQKRSRGANASYGDALDVTGAGYISAKLDNVRGQQEFSRAIEERSDELGEYWPIEIAGAMKRELREEIKGSGKLYEVIDRILVSHDWDEFRCFGVDRDLRHNHRNFIGFCRIPIDIGKWLGRKEVINGENCFRLEEFEPMNGFVRSLVAVDLKQPLSGLSVFDPQYHDRWVHSGLLTALLTQDYLFDAAIGSHPGEFQPEPIPELSRRRLRML